MTFTRYAVYYVPPADAGWAMFATRWLGWDLALGQTVPHPQMEGLDVAAITDGPRTYGLHATLKPPFRLPDSTSQDDLVRAVSQLALRQQPVHLHGLELTRMGRFLALRPTGDQNRLNALAAACVLDLDPYRAPMAEAELVQRRSTNLAAAHEANLIRWGYPYVMDTFRFHITLSSRLDKQSLEQVHAALTRDLAPLLPKELVIEDLALVGESPEGRFHLLKRFALTG